METIKAAGKAVVIIGTRIKTQATMPAPKNLLRNPRQTVMEIKSQKGI
jgi:hypothetical protein